MYFSLSEIRRDSYAGAYLSKNIFKANSELSRLSRGSLLHKELDTQNGYIADKQACSSGFLALLLMILAEREEMREEDR